LALQIATGNSHTCVLLDSGNVRCWGTPTSGQLGYANLATVGVTNVPAAVGVVAIEGACGNAVIDPGEACDGSVLPVGAAAGATCSSNCLKVIPPPVPVPRVAVLGMAVGLVGLGLSTRRSRRLPSRATA